MTPRGMTLEERERWAYANGDTATAALLGEALDHAADEYASGHADGYTTAGEDVAMEP